MDEQEAIEWYKRGVTPGWLEHTVKMAREAADGSHVKYPDDRAWRLVSSDISEQTGILIGAANSQRLAEYWGIE